MHPHIDDSILNCPRNREEFCPHLEKCMHVKEVYAIPTKEVHLGWGNAHQIGRAKIIKNCEEFIHCRHFVFETPKVKLHLEKK